MLVKSVGILERLTWLCACAFGLCLALQFVLM